MTIVYTTIFGGSDSLKGAPRGADRCVCFTDSKQRVTHGWDLVRHTPRDPRREAWHLRCIPHELFASYDRVIWIDASFTLMHVALLLKDAGTAKIAALRHHERDSPYWEGERLIRNGQASKADIDRQLHDYEANGFNPRHLSISSMLVRDRSDVVRRFNQTWDDQIKTYPGDNTQVSLDYSAWVHGIEIAALKGSRHRNPYATHDHLDHKLRRKPYMVAA